MKEENPKQTIIIDSSDRMKKPAGFLTSLFSLSDLLNLFILLVTLGIAVWSVEDARWISLSPSLMSAFIPSVLAGFILAKSRLPSPAAHLTALISGAAIVVIQVILIYPEPGLTDRWLRFADELQTWWHAAELGAPSPVVIHIALIFSYLAWIVGYFSAWALIKKNNPWIAVFFGTVVILVNLNFRSNEEHFHFLAFMAAALALLATSTFTMYSSRLTGRKGPFSGWGPRLWAFISVCLIVSTTFIAWDSSGFRVDKIAEAARSKNVFKSELDLYWKNFFAPARGSGPPLLVHGNQQDIRFSGSLELSDQVVFIINTERENYWKTQIYDVYQSTGWSTSEVDILNIDTEEARSGGMAADNILSYTVVPQVITNVLPVTGELVSSSVPVTLNSLAPQVFEINMTDSSEDSLLPGDIAAAAGAIRANQAAFRRQAGRIQALLPSGLKLVYFNYSRGGSLRSISVTRDQTEDSPITAVLSRQPLSLQQKVQMEAAVLDPPSQADLASAGTDYPKPITDRYLHLPDSLPDRVRDLAEEITRDAATPYQKAEAIEEYLAQYPYTLTIETPPVDADGVDFFLFTQKSGYCTYFASAMTVLLRAADVPARLVTGFLPGEPDTVTGGYVIRDRNYHAWTEVYFPGYGWIEYDATPPGAVPGTSDDIPAIDPVSPPDIPEPDQGAVQVPDTGVLPPGPVDDINPRIAAGVIAGIVFGLLLAAWALLYRRPSTSKSFYQRLVLLASLAGLGPRPWQTALEFSEKLSAALPRQSPAIKRITQIYVNHRYGGKTGGCEEDPALADSWPQLRRALLKKALRIPER